MSGNETVKIIMEAEAKAAELRENAVNDARNAVKEATEAAEQKVEAAEKAAAEDKKARLAAISEKASDVINEERKDAVFEAERLYNRAARHRDAAIRFICMEIKDRCQ